MVEIGGTTAGTILAASPTGWAATAASVATGGNYILNSYTSPATWTKPTGLKAIKVTVQAGGGNGFTVSSISGRGGGGGGASIRYIPAPSIPGPVALTVGATGGASSFGTFATATAGGNAGGSPAPATSGIGGAGTTTPGAGIINFSGQNGGLTSLISPIVTASGIGGNSLLGFGGQPVQTPAAGNNGVNFGSGGSGGASNPVAGTGAAGIVIVEEYY